MKLLPIVFALLTGYANAATYYFSDCQAGMDVNCVAGLDTRDATQAQDPTTPWATLAAAARPSFNSTGASPHTWRFARGGAWDGVQNNIYVPNGTLATPTVFESYTPTWCTGGCTSVRPILRKVAGTSTMFYFTDGGASNQDDYYTVRDLDLRGAGDNLGKGIYVFNDADYVTFDNVIVDGFDTGIHVDTNSGIADSSDGLSSHFTLKNSTIRNNTGNGFYGGGPWMLIENNTWDSNASDFSGKDPHHIYLGAVTQGAIVRGNTLTNHNKLNGVGSACSTVVIVAHETHPDLIVENNTIIETDSVGGCYGIDLNSNTTGSTKAQNFSRLIIRGNKIVISNTAQGIGCSSCPDALIENNILVRDGATGAFNGFGIPSSLVFQPARGDVADTKVTIRNNSVYSPTSGTTLTGLRLAITTAPGTGGDVITNNIFFFGAGSVASASCFFLDGRASNTFTAVNNNICYRAAGANAWSDSYATLLLAQGAGFDSASSAADPSMTVPAAGNNYTIEATGAGSIAINAANTTYKSRYGYRGKPLNGARDIGACEYRTADACSAAQPSVPSSATNLR